LLQISIGISLNRNTVNTEIQTILISVYHVLTYNDEAQNYGPEVGHRKLEHHIYTVSQKNIPDIFDSISKINYQILIISGTNIPDTTCHQMAIQFHTSPNVCFCTT